MKPGGERVPRAGTIRVLRALRTLCFVLSGLLVLSALNFTATLLVQSAPFRMYPLILMFPPASGAPIVDEAENETGARLDRAATFLESERAGALLPLVVDDAAVFVRAVDMRLLPETSVQTEQIERWRATTYPVGPDRWAHGRATICSMPGGARVKVVMSAPDHSQTGIWEYETDGASVRFIRHEVWPFDGPGSEALIAKITALGAFVSLVLALGLARACRRSVTPAA